MKMKHIACLGLMALLLCSCSTIPQENAVETSPHADAIQLVMTTQQDEIRKVDGNDWWHDVKPREWQARRPFHPGTIDSTHMFVVTYRIDGNVVQSWMVDTRNRTVDIERSRASQE
jgi:hypothetical protein